MSEPNYEHRETAGKFGTAFLFIYLIVILILSVVVLIAVWPSPEGPILHSRLATLSTELRYLLLVISSGALGGSIHSLTSFVEYVGARRLMKSWLLWYLYRVFVAVPLAMIFYLVIRGGIVSTGASASVLNPFGIAAVSGLVGMFSQSASDKLSEVVQTLFGRQSPVEKQIDRIGTILGVATLDNYEGYFCMAFGDQKGTSPSAQNIDFCELQPGKAYQLVTWFQQNTPKDGRAEEIKIAGGIDVKTVEFSLTADSESIRLEPRVATVSVPVRKRSDDVKFDFRVPDDIDSFEFWIQITQKNQFIAIVSKTVKVFANRPNLHT